MDQFFFLFFNKIELFITKVLKAVFICFAVFGGYTYAVGHHIIDPFLSGVLP